MVLAHNTKNRSTITIIGRFFVLCTQQVYRNAPLNLLDNLEFIALKGKGSDCEAGIYFSWRDTDKIRSAKHGRRKAAGFWRWFREQQTRICYIDAAGILYMQI